MKIVFFYKNAPKRAYAPSTLWRHNMNAPSINPGYGSLPDIKSGSMLILHLSTLIIVRIKFLLFANHQVYGILLQKPRQTKIDGEELVHFKCKFLENSFKLYLKNVLSSSLKKIDKTNCYLVNFSHLICKFFFLYNIIHAMKYTKIKLIKMNVWEQYL